jgi:hypothetical protein
MPMTLLLFFFPKIFERKLMANCIMQRRMRPFEFLFDALLPPRETRKLVRRMDEAAVLAALRQSCGKRMRCGQSLPYQDPIIEACILEAKFHGNLRAAEFLGRALREFLSNSSPSPRLSIL